VALSLRLVAAALAAIAIAACAQAAPAVSDAAKATTAPAAAQPSANPALEGSAVIGAAPTVDAPPPPAAAPGTLLFSGLPPGAFPVHVHAVCNATQAYHLSVLAPLLVDSHGSGGISVPAANLAHGWCAIVYSDAGLRRVLAERPL
jgi:Cu/Zn superoxide dismutase